MESMIAWLVGALIVLGGFLAVLLYLTYETLMACQRIARALDAQERPQQATHLPQPGTSWLPTDQEVALKEEQLAGESRQRWAAGFSKSSRSYAERKA